MNQEKIVEVLRKSKNLKVLYVEDNDDVRNQTTKMLSVFFETIDLATNGNEGFTLFKANVYDIIITDIKMPEVDGMALIKMIRQINFSIPILILSAHDDKDYLLKSIDYNIEGYILKPYNINQIAQCIEKVVMRNETMFSKDVIYLVDDYAWDKDKRSLTKNSEKIKLTNNELRLFEVFSNSTNYSLTYHDIEMTLFNDYNFDNRRIRNLLSRLRKKTEIDLFNSIYGYGYELRIKK